MMLERSIQAKFLQPVVVSLAFGVFIAFFVTLLMVPALYAIGSDADALRTRVKRWVKRKVLRDSTESSTDQPSTGGIF